MIIPFNKPPFTGEEQKYILESLQSEHISGDGLFTQKCEKWFEEKLKCKKTFLCTSCTHALEMSALLIDIKEGDEVIMPSFTFVSTANAFSLRGARVVFVDINPETMNIDENQIEEAITTRTKAIVVVHYAGVSCEMDKILDISKKHKLYLIEDAAQCVMSNYKGIPLGTIGHIGTFSFHETKNITSAGEGGLLIINDESFVERAEVIREKGTNRKQFFRGEVNKYSWVDIGSSYLLSDLSAAYLWGQIKNIDKIILDRVSKWKYYYNALIKLEEKKYISLPKIPQSVNHNGHIFFIKVQNKEIRNDLLNYLQKNKVYATFHYVPLHSSPYGVEHSIFIGKDVYTTKESDCLIRLPLFYSISEKEIDKAVSIVMEFFNEY